MSQVNDPFFDQEVLPYKVIPNPNNPEDKRICLLVQDASPFDGAVIQYTRFKLSDQINLDELIDITDDGQMSTFSKNLQDDYNKFKNEQENLYISF